MIQNYHHRQHKTVVPGVLVLDKPELETPTGLNEVPDPIDTSCSCSKITILNYYLNS
jgi:hypothetical protein